MCCMGFESRWVGAHRAHGRFACDAAAPALAAGAPCAAAWAVNQVCRLGRPGGCLDAGVEQHQLGACGRRAEGTVG